MLPSNIHTQADDPHPPPHTHELLYRKQHNLTYPTSHIPMQRLLYKHAAVEKTNDRKVKKMKAELRESLFNNTAPVMWHISIIFIIIVIITYRHTSHLQQGIVMVENMNWVLKPHQPLTFQTFKMAGLSATGNRSDLWTLTSRQIWD